MPRSPVVKQQPTVLPPVEKTAEPSVLKGKVVDLEGRPIPGASVAGYMLKDAVKTGPTGEFVYPAEKAIGMLTVEAPGFASRSFKFESRTGGRTKALMRGHALIEPTGVITDPLIMGSGVAVTGRVMRNGKPVAGVTMGLTKIDRDGDMLKYPETKTDDAGRFRFPHILAEHEFWAAQPSGAWQTEARSSRY